VTLLIIGLSLSVLSLNDLIAPVALSLDRRTEMRRVEKGIPVAGLGICIAEGLEICGPMDGEKLPTDVLPGASIVAVSGVRIRDHLHLTCLLATQTGHTVDVELAQQGQPVPAVQWKVRPGPNPSRSDLFRLCQLAEPSKPAVCELVQTDPVGIDCGTQTRPQEIAVRAEWILDEQCRVLRDQLGSMASRCEKAERIASASHRQQLRNLLQELGLLEAQRRLEVVVAEASRRLEMVLEAMPTPWAHVVATGGSLPSSPVLDTPALKVSTCEAAVQVETSDTSGEKLKGASVAEHHDFCGRRLYCVRNGVRLALLPPKRKPLLLDEMLAAEVCSGPNPTTELTALAKRCRALEAEVARLFLKLPSCETHRSADAVDCADPHEALPPRVEHLVSALRRGREVQPEVLCAAFTESELKLLFNFWYAGLVGDFFTTFLQPLSSGGTRLGSQQSTLSLASVLSPSSAPSAPRGRKHLSQRDFELWLRGRLLPADQRRVCEEGLRLWVRRGAPYDVMPQQPPTRWPADLSLSSPQPSNAP
jgi:hypothetical protein